MMRRLLYFYAHFTCDEMRHREIICKENMWVQGFRYENCIAPGFPRWFPGSEFLAFPAVVHPRCLVRSCAGRGMERNPDSVSPVSPVSLVCPVPCVGESLQPSLPGVRCPLLLTCSPALTDVNSSPMPRKY